MWTKASGIFSRKEGTVIVDKRANLHSSWVVLRTLLLVLSTKWRNYQENAYKVIDIIKELKSTNTGCYFDIICDVAERKYGFENTATESYPDFCINYGFITPVKQ